MKTKTRTKTKTQPVMVGLGIFQKIRDFMTKAIPVLRSVSQATGIKPSDYLSKYSQTKGGLTGVLGTEGAKFLSQQGFGNFKKGTCIKCNEMVGSGFFSDFAKGFKSVFNPIVDIAAPIISTFAPEVGVPLMAANQAIKGMGPSSFRGRGSCGVGYSNSSSVPTSVRSLKLT